MKKRKAPIVLIALFVAAIILIAAAFVSYRGGFYEVLGLPPIVDSSSPISQNGYQIALLVRRNPKNPFRYEPSKQRVPPASIPNDFRQVHIVDYTSSDDVAGIWITTPKIETNLPSEVDYIADDTARTPPLFYVTERASTGETFPAKWHFFSQTQPQVLFVPIPGGYSDKLKWIDIILADAKHRMARWRIERLPATRLAISKSPTIEQQFTFRGATVTGRAIRDFGYGIRVDRLPRVPIDQGQKWDIRYDNPITNWEPASGDLDVIDAGTIVDLTDPQIVRSFRERGYITRCTSIDTPFAGNDTAVRQSGTLTQFDTLTETVRFHHVPLIELKDFYGKPYSPKCFGLRIGNPLIASTPSGIKITLWRQSPQEEVAGFDPLTVTFAVSPSTWNRWSESVANWSSQKTFLKQSSLVQHYHQPVSLKVQFTIDGIPAEIGSDTSNSEQYIVGLNPTGKMSAQLPNHLKRSRYADIDVSVLQRVDLASGKFTLTLPLENPIASDRPFDSPWNPLIK